MTTTKIVSANIRALLAIHMKTIGEMAEKLEVSRQTAGLYANGSSSMTSDQLAVIAKWLEVPVGELFREDVYELTAT